MKKYLLLISLLIFIACTNNVKYYSIQVQGKLYGSDTTYTIGGNYITDSTLVNYYDKVKELPDISSSHKLSYWYETWFSHNINSNLIQKYKFNDYEIKVKGLVKDPDSDKTYVINKRYISD